MAYKRIVTIHCDGACKKDGFGGWGAHLDIEGACEEVFGGEANTTNNRMELIAAIEALRAVTGRAAVTVVTDSQYVINGITQWIKGWKARGWVTKEGEPVKNRELWQELDQEAARHDVEWQWQRGHVGHAGNERADALANEGVEYARREALKQRRADRAAEQEAQRAPLKSIAKRRTRPPRSRGCDTATTPPPNR